MKILIKDTTRAEREAIVAESLDAGSDECDGCAPGMLEMYQDYIDGKKELNEINRSFQPKYVSGIDIAPEHACDRY